VAVKECTYRLLPTAQQINEHSVQVYTTKTNA